ncbi:MAG: 16S rRNA (guanine(966)-N(2))-methyltransferase RsmD [Thermoleophilia bacterium]|nr:16S rRNA (guanine(966)-N(2))-methyltransferase RsmD [Thermoleophilia bacterium]
MRIIAGSRKGARIFAPKGRETRPTSDRVREAAFNLIGPLGGARVLDLYAGSGALGLEALSRGALRVTFVESDRDAVRAIERNLDRLGLGGAEIARADAPRRVAADAAAGRRYDLVLIDPPYGMLETALANLSPHLPAVVAEGGLVVVESDARAAPVLPLPVRTSRRYGSTRLTVFEASGEPA